ncbi:hypothetical protein EGK63_15190 [Brevundimonas sp. 357]|nr:hypothetical protein EGK63_15190 [Brevundimonas sp. 357]
MPAMPYLQIPAFMKRLADSQGMSARALEFTILTASRESMTLKATWGEIRDDVWELDKSRRRSGPFASPCQPAHLAVLEAIRPTGGGRPNQLIFPRPKGGAMRTCQISSSAASVSLSERKLPRV